MIVVFEETGEEREVTRGCTLCKADPETAAIVSPQGVAHESDGYGVTVCGHDATGPDWWWRY